MHAGMIPAYQLIAKIGGVVRSNAQWVSICYISKPTEHKQPIKAIFKGRPSPSALDLPVQRAAELLFSLSLRDGPTALQSFTSATNSALVDSKGTMLLGFGLVGVALFGVVFVVSFSSMSPSSLRLLSILAFSSTSFLEKMIDRNIRNSERSQPASFILIHSFDKAPVLTR